MPEEIVFIVPVSIVAGTLMITTIVGSILKFLREKHRTETPAGSSLTTSELQRLMREAVETATAPLHERLDALEHRLDAPAPLLLDAPSADDDVLDFGDEVTREPDLRRPSRRPTR